MRRRLLAAALCVGLALTVAAVPTGSAATAVNAAVVPLRIMTMGDSITCGAGCTTTSAYRGELDPLLTAAGVPHEFVVQAVGGSTCAYWLPRAYTLTAQYLPDLVLLNCGTNDGPMTGTAGAAFETTYRDLLTALLSGGAWHTRVIPAYIQYSAVGGYPYPAKAPAWLATSEPIVNDAIWRSLNISDPHGPARIPAFADFQQIPEQYLDEGGVHPTASGDIVMARIWYNALRPVYGWPDIAPLPCGMSGRRAGWGSPPYAPIRPGCAVV